MMKKIKEGDLLEISSTDPGFTSDIKSWCDNTGNQLLKVEKIGDVIKALIQKGQAKKFVQEDAVSVNPLQGREPEYHCCIQRGSG